MVKVEMHFRPMSTCLATCATANATTAKTLEVQYKGKNIAQILDLTVEARLPS